MSTPKEYSSDQWKEGTLRLVMAIKRRGISELSERARTTAPSAESSQDTPKTKTKQRKHEDRRANKQIHKEEPKRRQTPRALTAKRLENSRLNHPSSARIGLRPTLCTSLTCRLWKNSLLRSFATKWSHAPAIALPSSAPRP